MTKAFKKLSQTQAWEGVQSIILRKRSKYASQIIRALGVYMYTNANTNDKLLGMWEDSRDVKNYRQTGQ